MSCEKIKISVIVPVYNQKKTYLDECVSSICKQTYKNLEIILVDDGSAISCSKTCDDYCLKDNRIKVIHKENGGTASARNAGILAASGDYVAFVDSDDWIDSDIYNNLISNLDENEIDIISFGFYRNYENGEPMEVSNYNKILYCEKKDFEKEVFPYFVNTSDFADAEMPLMIYCYLYKVNLARAVARKINNDIKTSEDFLFLLQALLNAESFCFFPYGGYHYRSNLDSKVHTLKNVKELQYRTYKAADHAIRESDYDEYNKSILRKKNILATYRALMNKDYSVLVDEKSDFLFPYSEVRRGSKILIYGAGKLGKQIYKIVKSSMNYEIIGVADKNWKFYEEQGLDVISPEDILSLNYDYIIIAIAYANIKKQVKEYLVKLGISKDKIAEIDLNILDEEHLPF